jgi:phage tail-like protein
MPGITREDPLSGFAFLVEIDGIDQAFFKQVSGLSAEAEVVEYREGGGASSPRKLPGRVRYGNVTLSRGLTTSRELWDWWASLESGKLQRRNVAIVLLDATLQPVLRWLLRDAWVARYEVGSLRADSNEVLIESVELAHEGLELE